MQDRPTVDELLEAIANYLANDVMPATQGRVSFHARVAANTIAIIRRELAHEEDDLGREWQGLARLLGQAEQPGSLLALRAAVEARNHELVGRIQAGEGDAGPWREALLAHLREVTVAKLRVTNPAWLDARPAASSSPR